MDIGKYIPFTGQQEWKRSAKTLRGLKNGLNKLDTWFAVNNVNISNDKDKILHFGQERKCLSANQGLTVWKGKQQ